MEALANLGIDWKLFLAQAINFLILLFILRRYAYKPMLDFLEKRTERIDKGLKDAEAAQKKLSEMEKKEKEVMAKARNEAQAIIAAAEESAKKRDAKRLAETEAKTKRFVEDARMKIEEEKDKVMGEVKSEVAEIVALSVEKLLRERVDTRKDEKIIAHI